jgi:hypothetical protein
MRWWPAGGRFRIGPRPQPTQTALHELTTNGLLERAGLPQPGTSGLV